MKRTDSPYARLNHVLSFMVVLSSLIFSTWLMVHTFSYNSQRQYMEVGSRLWSDFGAHIPMIRSFSMGDNFLRMLQGKMPEYPLFPGEPIRYHFLFFAFAGLLERLGVRIDWALNIPSILGFSLLLTALCLLAKNLFESWRVAFLSVCFFLFNGSLSFIRFFQKHPFGGSTITDILKANEFPSFAPWGPGDITAFWNLNIYTNQRHLALAFGLGIAFIYTLVKIEEKPFRKQIPWGIIWGIIIGIFPFLHQPTLVIFTCYGIFYFLLFPKLRKVLCITGIIAGILVFAQYPVIPKTQNSISFYPGYLLHDTLAGSLPLREKVIKFFWYWFQNLGGHLFLAPIGFILANKRIKKLFMPLLLLFLFPNIFKLSIEVAASHKFFNFFLILSGILSAYTLIRFYDWCKALRPPYTYAFALSLSAITVFFLLFSGIIDFFVVANDSRGTLLDIESQPAAAWIAGNTPTDAVFLNGTYLYNPASLAGRFVYLGWPYFAWSAGYETTDRFENEMKPMYQPNNPTDACRRLRKNNIRYIMLEKNQDLGIPVYSDFYMREKDYFTVEYQTPDKDITILSQTEACRNL